LTINKQIHVYILLSIFAASLIILMVYFSSPSNSTNINIRLFAGLTFIVCCIIGILCAKYPGWARRIFKVINHQISSSEQVNKKKVKYEGHHPKCNQFENHTIYIHGKTYCAGCFSLAIGAVVSIILMALYIVNFPRLSHYIYYILIFIAMGIISICFIEIKNRKRNSTIHVIINILFVVSFFLITVCVLEITGELIFGLVAILFSFLWLDTRAQLSFWQHAKICAECNKNCKMY